MQRRALLMAAPAVALAGCSSLTPPRGAPYAPDSPAGGGARSGAGDAFDVTLYRAIARQPGNQFVSPYSVAAAFSLVYPGAGGSTAGEISAAFGFDRRALVQARQTRALAESIAAESGGSEFTEASAAWVEQSLALRPEYVRAIQEELGGVIEPVDFLRNQADALRQINAWAARATRDRIPEILGDEAPDRRLVLTNAIYFKGRWRDPFPGSATTDGDFHTGLETRVSARLMRQVTDARYFATSSFQAADFDYHGGAFGLAVFLPRTRDGLAAFESALTGDALDGYMTRLSAAESSRLDLTLPKIEMRAHYNLSEPLQHMGVRSAFSAAADFSAITADESLMISAVIHKTFLAIDEEGTEAAAVTAADIVTSGARRVPPPPPPIEFRADRPFFVVLHHKPTRTRLFLGRIATTV